MVTFIVNVAVAGVCVADAVPGDNTTTTSGSAPLPVQYHGAGRDTHRAHAALRPPTRTPQPPQPLHRLDIAVQARSLACHGCQRIAGHVWVACGPSRMNMASAALQNKALYMAAAAVCSSHTACVEGISLTQRRCLGERHPGINPQMSFCHTRHLHRPCPVPRLKFLI